MAKVRLNATNGKNKKRRLVLQPMAVFEQVTINYVFGFIMLILVCLRLLFNVTVLGICRVQENVNKKHISCSDFPKRLL